MKRPIELRGDPAREVIPSNDYAAYPMAETYRELSANTNEDFSAVIRLMENLPIFVSGDAHKSLRREMAKAYAATRLEQEQNLEAVFFHLREKIALNSGAFDVLGEVSEPVWKAIFSAICPGMEELRELIFQLPTLFNPATSFRHRKRLNDALQEVLDTSDDSLLERIALLTLGVRSLSGSLALSIHKLARENAGSRLCDIEFPESFSDSALRFVDRISLHESAPDGCPHAAGTRFRCISFDEGYTEEQNQKGLYGIGAHICLGKPVSQLVWSRIGELFAASEKRIQPGAYEVVEREPFLLPTVCEITLS